MSLDHYLEKFQKLRVDKRGDHEAVDLHVHRVQSPTADARSEHAAFFRLQLGHPG